MYKNNLLLGLLFCGLVTNAFANPQQLGDSKDLGLGEDTERTAPVKRDRSQEKISNLGEGAYIRQFNDFGQPMVEVHPENGPSYYYNQKEIQTPNPADSVYQRETPTWMLGQW